MPYPEPNSSRRHACSADDSDGTLLRRIEPPLLDVFKSPACAPKDNSCYQDGTSDGAYYEIGGTRTLRSFVLWGVGVPHWIPDAAVCARPSEVTDAGGFVTTHPMAGTDFTLGIKWAAAHI